MVSLPVACTRLAMIIILKFGGGLPMRLMFRLITLGLQGIGRHEGHMLHYGTVVTLAMLNLISSDLQVSQDQLIVCAYLIFVISFTQAGFSNSKFYT